MPMVAVRAPDTLTLGSRPAVRAFGSPRRRQDRLTGVLGWCAAAGIGVSAAVMVAVSLAGPSAAVVRLPGPNAGPPWWIPLHPSAAVVTVALWAASVLGGGGVAAGLAAVARGARPSGRALVLAALAVTALLTVLPSAGSSDTLDYAAYGRIAATGHSPYRMTPLDLRKTGDPVGLVAPTAWEHSPSVYGPLATAEQSAAAVLGGSSPTAVIFWIKLWNSLAFAAIVLVLDRLLRSDPARRARAHLLWSLNPLLLWGLVAAGHVDALACAMGVLGVFALTTSSLAGPGAVRRGLAAGAMVGLAADFKITFALFGLGLAWAARKSWRVVLAAAAGAFAVLVPSYLFYGSRAATVLIARRGQATIDNLYQLLDRMAGIAKPPGLAVLAVPLLVTVGWLLLSRLPDRVPGLPAVQPALALSIAWLLTWPYQRPWYDAIAFCLLAVYPASRLDWLMLSRLFVVTVYYMPGMPGVPKGWLGSVNHLEAMAVVPVVRLAVLAGAVVLAVTGLWQSRRGHYLPEGVLLADFAKSGQLKR